MWNSSKCYKIIPIRLLMTCERVLWSSSKYFRIIFIIIILTCECIMWSTSEYFRIKPIRAIMTCECVMLSTLECFIKIPVRVIMMCERVLWSSLECFRITRGLRSLHFTKENGESRGGSAEAKWSYYYFQLQFMMLTYKLLNCQNKASKDLVLLVHMHVYVVCAPVIWNGKVLAVNNM